MTNLPKSMRATLREMKPKPAPRKQKHFGTHLDVRVRPYSEGDPEQDWTVFINGQPSGMFHHTREHAMIAARNLCRALTNTYGFLVELTPHNRDGTISKRGKATFPRSSDPRRHKG